MKGVTYPGRKETMRIWGVSEADIRESAAEVGLVIFNDYRHDGVRPVGRGFDCRLGVDMHQPRDEAGYLPFQRLGMQGRRLPYVCWHGHKRFMLAIFDRNPDAKIRTALAVYHGKQDFWKKHRDTFGRGNDYHLAYGQRCNCGSNAAIPTERR